MKNRLAKLSPGWRAASTGSAAESRILWAENRREARGAPPG
ncbi:MAG: hypothetical protein ABI690_29740 [Chloroflexota bacterium]